MRLLLLIALAGCEGSFTGGLLPATGQPAMPGNEEAEEEVNRCTATPTPGSAPMRRLSHDEYAYVLTDLFGDAALAQQVTAGFLEDATSLGFRNGALLLDVKPVLLQRYQEAAETVAARVTANDRLSRWVPCAVTASTACARESIERLLLKAYRRPPTAADLSRLLTVFTAGSEGAATEDAAFRTGMEWVVLTVLQAPKFFVSARARW